MNSETSQNNASNCSVYASEESSAGPSATETLADASAESEATLVIQLGYRGAAFCGFAEQPT
ncbi:MAG: tRNA pseudouridine(38-40) synthase TruA, partial [Lancefieldella parvula]|nr:tRNA pseudouridine(38-40) synthase TruA [Lancefieldella parvula]